MCFGGQKQMFVMQSQQKSICSSDFNLVNFFFEKSVFRPVLEVKIEKEPLMN